MKNEDQAWADAFVLHRSNIEEAPVFIADYCVSSNADPILTVGSVDYPAMNCRVAGI
jgi:hypothetical protein